MLCNYYLRPYFFWVGIFILIRAVGLGEIPASVTSNGSPVGIGSIPDWVEEQTFASTGSKAPQGSPAEILLTDAQDRLTPEASEYYYRIVIRLLNAEGVRQNSEWSVVYSPEFESVTWHTLKITRNGVGIDRLPDTKFKRLQRELGFESKVYSGEITAAAVLDDIRVGDVIEVAYTLHRENPVMQGHMTARHYLGSVYPVRKQTVLVRAHSDAADLSWSYFVPPGIQNLPRDIFSPAALRTAMDTQVVGNEKLYRWSAENIPGIIFDHNISPRAWPYYPMLRTGTFKTWATVVEWALPLFTDIGELPPDMVRLVDQWQRTLPTPGERLRAAVAWVQDDIRYFAMAIGDHNVRPRPLPEVCDSRFGDCKDKTVLLVTLLRQLGFEAWPALVNTYWQDRIQDHGPGPFAFNHAIVAYRHNDLLCWVDPTLKHQRDRDGVWALPPYRSGLILRPNEYGLTAIPGRSMLEPDSVTYDVFSINDASGEATLTTTISLFDLQADNYRQQMEAVTMEQTSAAWYNFIGRFYKKLREVQPPQIIDDPEANEIRITAVYGIPDFLKTTATEQSVEVYAYGLRMLLEPPETRRRRWPYALPSGRFIRHRIDLELPFDLQTEQLPQAVSAQGVEYSTEKGLVGRRFTAVHNLRFTSDSVPADKMDIFSDAVDEIIDAMGTSISTKREATNATPVPRTEP